MIDDDDVLFLKATKTHLSPPENPDSLIYRYFARARYWGQRLHFRRFCMPNKPGTPQKRKASPSRKGGSSSTKKKRGSNSVVKGFGWKQQKACVVCNHFRAKKQCIFQKCRRCCGKDGSKRCPYHHEEYEEEKRILALANSNRTVSASGIGEKDAHDDALCPPIPDGVFHEKAFKNIGDTACIFHLNSLFINEKNEWIENQERKYLRNLKRLGRKKQSEE